ncbi:hypothetical protein [Globicatella sanguinis]|uniref:hypothetical protein n=1 Tax=Globicatella sanguinis TaxID=13076 RepID=UPI0008259547|nr:hypothetical protein [Globicatella sanguinis]
MANLNFDLQTLAEGEVAGRIQNELSKIANNILDLNTEADKSRKLIIEIDFKPNEKRDALATKVLIKSKLEPQVKTETTMLIGRDINTGMVAMNELVSGVRGQMFFDPEDNVLKTDAGEVVDEIENETIVDFNKRKSGGI